MQYVLRVYLVYFVWPPQWPTGKNVRSEYGTSGFEPRSDQVKDWKMVASLVSVHHLRPRAGLVVPVSVYSDWVGYRAGTLKPGLSLDQLQQIWQLLSYMAIQQNWQLLSYMAIQQIWQLLSYMAIQQIWQLLSYMAIQQIWQPLSYMAIQQIWQLLSYMAIQQIWQLLSYMAIQQIWQPLSYMAIQQIWQPLSYMAINCWFINDVNPFTHSPAHSHSLADSLTSPQSPTRSLTHQPTVTHSLTHSPAHSHSLALFHLKLSCQEFENIFRLYF